MYVWACMCFIYICNSMYACMCGRACVLYAYVCVYMYTHTHTHTLYTYTRTRTHKLTFCLRIILFVSIQRSSFMGLFFSHFL